MISRYSLPEMVRIWSEERRLALWQEIEALAAEGWETAGAAPPGTAAAIRAAETPATAEVAEREAVTQHDVAAFVDLLSERSGEAGAWVHYGLTSSDVLDTATGVLLAESNDLLAARLSDLFDVVKARAFEHRETQMVGRTHGVWAEPTTFGLKLAGWAFELARDHQRLAASRETVAVGKVSGAVGTYAHVPPEIEAHVCLRLGLAFEPASTQVTARDRHAAFLQTAALSGASIERFATEVRHLARSEVQEVQEAFREGQKGSSSMPHKRNPVISERMTGLARLLRGYAQVGLENVALWHERDISHSSAERVILPDACYVLHYMLVTFRSVLENIAVDSGRMQENLQSTRGLVHSQAVLQALLDKGLARDDAYRLVQRGAALAWDEELDLQDVLSMDPEVPLTAEELGDCFSAELLLEKARVVFDRLEDLRLS